MARKRLGELLLERGVIDTDQLASALAYQRQWGHRLGAALVAKGFLSEGELCQALGEALAIPVIDLSEIRPDPQAARVLDQRFCQTHELVPIAVDHSGNRKVLTCAMTDPMDMAAIDEIEFTADCKLKAVLSPLSQIRAVMQWVYRGIKVKIPSFEETSRKVPERMEILHADGTGSHEIITLDAEGNSEQVPSGSPALKGQLVPPGLAARAGKDPSREVTDRTALAEIIREHEVLVKKRSEMAAVQGDLDYLFGVSDQDTARLEKLERNFWTLMRLLAKKGAISREEWDTQFKKD
ncbi:MAG: hypothetical protein P1V51_16150 [Deltaproteobacteria bacterium]|nr:hypothetical protein [Deltaproteobacteria bacterium]